jgi:hypothetical protein
MVFLLKNLKSQNQGRSRRGALNIELSKFLIERPVDKLSEDILALDRKQYRLVTGFMTGQCA